MDHASFEFKKFASTWNFEHVTSSLRNPQSNGKVENAVRTIERLFTNCHAAGIALLDWRNTPSEGMVTKVQHSDWCAAARRLYSRRPKHFLNLASASSTMPTNCASRKSVRANMTIVENALFHPSCLARLSASGYLDQRCGNQLSASEKSLRGLTMSELAKQLLPAIGKPLASLQRLIDMWLWPRYLRSLRKKLCLRPSLRLQWGT